MAWVLGWAVPGDWFAALVREAIPAATHLFFPAERNVLEQLEKEAPLDWVVGYSLGTLLLLCEAKRASRLGQVALLAPIFAFPSEADLGGRVARVQVRQLARRLRRDACTALTDFYLRAGLDVPREHVPAAATEAMLWGLEHLENDRAEPPLPANWRAWCGENDALLDAERLHRLAPKIEMVPGASHHPDALIQAFALSVIEGA